MIVTTMREKPWAKASLEFPDHWTLDILGIT